MIDFLITAILGIIFDTTIPGAGGSKPCRVTFGEDDNEFISMDLDSLGSGTEPFADYTNSVCIVKKNNTIVHILWGDVRFSGDEISLDPIIRSNNFANSIFENSLMNNVDFGNDILNNYSEYTFDIYRYDENTIGSYIENSLTLAEEVFLDEFFDNSEPSIENPLTINGLEQNLTTFEKDGANIKIGFSGVMAAPDEDFIQSLTLIKDGVDLLDNIVVSGAMKAAGVSSSVDGNQRVYTIPAVGFEIEEADYRLEIVVLQRTVWNVNITPINQTFNVADNEYRITKAVIEKDTPNNKFNLFVTFDRLPDYGDDFPFYFELSEIQAQPATNFVFDSFDGNIVKFVSSKTINDTGFADDTNETFIMKLIEGVLSTTSDPQPAVTWFAVYKWTDNQGKIHRSRISSPTSQFVPSNKIGEGADPVSYTFQVSCLNLTEKEDVFIELYRVVFVDFVAQISRKVKEVRNDKNASIINITDDVSNDNLQDLFLTKNTDQPRSGNILFKYKNRVYIANNNEIYFSEELLAEGQDAISFKIDSVRKFNDKIIGIGGLDNSLIVFTEKQTFGYVIGTDPIPIKSLDNHVLTSHQSIVNFRDGILFQSDQGIFILDRGFTTRFIGDNIKKTILETLGRPTSIGNPIAGKRIVEGVVQEGLQEIFLRLNDESSIIYNYLYNKWSIETYSSKSKLFLNSISYKLDNSGRLLCNQEKGPIVRSIIETGDIHLTAIQAFFSLKRIWLSGDFGDWEQFIVSFAYNTSPIFEDTRDIVLPKRYGGYTEEKRRWGEEGSQYAPEDPNKYQIMIEPRLKKIYAINIKIELQSRNAVLSNIAFEAFQSPTFFPTTAQQRL